MKNIEKKHLGNELRTISVEYANTSRERVTASDFRDNDRIIFYAEIGTFKAGQKLEVIITPIEEPEQQQ